MEHIIGIIAMIGGFVSMIINNTGGAYCCFGFAFILWCVMAVLRKQDKDPRSVAYICDRKKCDCTYGNCHHTLDIKHAANFEEIEPGKFIEKE